MSSEIAWSALEDVVLDIIDRRGVTPLKLGGDFTDAGYRVISAKLVKAGHIQLDADTPRYVDEEIYKKWMRTPLRRGDVIMTSEAPLGEVAFLAEEVNWVLGQRLFAIRPRPEMLDGRFLYYALQSGEVKADLHGRASGSTVQGIRQAELRRVRVPVPELIVQRSISSVLGALDDRITLLRETNTTLEAIAQALFQSWFVDFDPVHAKQQGRAPEGMDAQTAALFPDSFEESELGMVPKGWRASNLGEIANFQNGYAFKSKDWQDSGHPVVKIGDVKPGIIDLSGCSFVSPSTLKGLDRFGLFRGDLLVGMTGYVGETGLVPSHNPQAFLNQRVGRIAAKNKQAYFEYIYCAIRNSAFKEFAGSQSHGSAQANVSGTSILEYPIVLPCEKIIDAFSGIVKVLIEKILTNHEQALALASCRDTLLPRLISGQLRLPEAQALMASATND